MATENAAPAAAPATQPAAPAAAPPTPPKPLEATAPAASTLTPEEKAKALEEYRASLRKELTPEQAAIREEKRRLQREQQAFTTSKTTIEKENADLKARLKEAESDPFAFAAKVRGVEEVEIYNEKTKRGVNPMAAEIDDLKKRLAASDERWAKAEEERVEREQQALRARTEQNFHAHVSELVGKGEAYPLLGDHAEKHGPQTVSRAVWARIEAHHAQTLEDTGQGEILDIKEILEKMESELEEAAERQAKRLQEFRQKRATAEGSPGPHGAVETANGEATRSPRTMTTALATQVVSKPSKAKSRRERLAEAEQLLRGEPESG